MKTQSNFIIKINGHIQTGGPMAMLQLGSKLKDVSSNVILCFDDLEAKKIFSDWVSRFFQNVDIILSKNLADYKTFNLIVTETDLQTLRDLNWSGFIVCYMLSVDNCAAYGLKRLTFEANVRHLKNIFKQILKRNYISWKNLTSKVDLFIAQSHYAMEILGKSSLTTPAFFIGDYIENSKVISERRKRKAYPKSKLRVCYNPKKGTIYSAIARFLNRSIEFVPIQRLNEQQLVKLFQTCDAYVDFGSQPGKDRLPREAIACDCPSFILQSGAGYNYSDFPRSKIYRFKISDLISLTKIIRVGVHISDNNALFNRSRAAEVFVEESEFKVRVEQLIQIFE